MLEKMYLNINIYIHIYVISHRIHGTGIFPRLIVCSGPCTKLSQELPIPNSRKIRRIVASGYKRSCFYGIHVDLRSSQKDPRVLMQLKHL